MICRIIREKTPREKARRYHTNVVISKKVRNRINRIPGVTNLSFSSGYEICVEIGRAFDWDTNSIDKKIILILLSNFVSKMRLDSDEETECVVEDIDNFSGEPTLIAFFQLSDALNFLDKQKDDQNEN